MSAVINFKPRTPPRVPLEWETVVHLGEVRGVKVEVWRRRDGVRCGIALSPTARGHDFVARGDIETLDLLAYLATTVLSALKAADRTWNVVEDMPA